jgi:hypothetical protein
MQETGEIVVSRKRMLGHGVSHEDQNHSFILEVESYAYAYRIIKR